MTNSRKIARTLGAALVAASLSAWGAAAWADEIPPAKHDVVHGSDAPKKEHGHGKGHGKGGGHGEGQGEKTGLGDGHHGEKAAGASKSEHGEAEGAHSEEHKAFNWVDFSNKATPPFIAVLLNFALLVGIYFKMGKGPVAAGLRSRREGVAKEIEEAQRMLKEATARARVYQAKLENLESELESAKKALAEVGKGERDRIVRDAQEKAERMQKDAHFLIEQEIKQMGADLRREAVELAVEAAEQILKEKVSQADHERLAGDLLTELGKKPAAVAGRPS